MQLRALFGKVFLAGASVAALAFVSVPSVHAQAGVINACANIHSGEIKIVAAGSVCPEDWVLLQWNSVGAPQAVGNFLHYWAGMYPGTSVARAFCPPGTKVVGGGGLSLSGVGLRQSFPIANAGGETANGPNALGWQVAASDWSDVQASVVCAAP